MQPPAIEIIGTNDALIKEEQPYMIYIMHKTGVRVEHISSRNSHDFIMSAYHQLIEIYSNESVAAALYAPDGRRIAFDIHTPTKWIN